MGFIGANGTGKTTTIQSILNLVHADGGEVRILGKHYIKHELALKQELGYAFGGIDYYTRSKIKKVTNVIKRFYSNWDDEAYSHYLKLFELDENKKIIELSTGIRVKYNLALALSHGAKLLILDEPTSGLDAVARDNLLEIFQKLVEDRMNIVISGTSEIPIYQKLLEQISAKIY